MRKLLALLMLLTFGCENVSKESDSGQDSIGNEAVLSVDSSENTNSSEYFDLGNFQELVEKYEAPERSEWQEPDFIIDKLQPVKNLVVADIGAGTGYFTFRLAEEGAKVIAIDIDDRFLDYIETRKTELLESVNPSQISTRLSSENDPFLRENEVDVALLVNTYHF